jgi:hypothetical protein
MHGELMSFSNGRGICPFMKYRHNVRFVDVSIQERTLKYKKGPGGRSKTGAQ